MDLTKRAKSGMILALVLPRTIPVLEPGRCQHIAGRAGSPITPWDGSRSRYIRQCEGLRAWPAGPAVFIDK